MRRITTCAISAPRSRRTAPSVSHVPWTWLRLIHCALGVDEHLEDEDGHKGLDIRQTLFVDRARLW